MAYDYKKWAAALLKERDFPIKWARLLLSTARLRALTHRPFPPPQDFMKTAGIPTEKDLLFLCGAINHYQIAQIDIHFDPHGHPDFIEISDTSGKWTTMPWLEYKNLNPPYRRCTSCKTPFQPRHRNNFLCPKCLDEIRSKNPLLAS